MPLSEHEQRKFADIARHLLEEDPRFARQIGPSMRANLVRRIRISAVVFLVGLVVVVLGFTQSRYLGLAGFGLMVASAFVLVQAVRRRMTVTETEVPSPASPVQPPAAPRQEPFWKRMNDRWRERWDEGRERPDD